MNTPSSPVPPKDDLGSLIDVLDLSDIQRRFLRLRWLDQVHWMGGRADRCRFRFYALRLVAVVGGVVVPTLIGLNPTGAREGILRGATIVVSLLVAAAVAVEELLRYGERYRHYRRTVEQIKSEGWQFFQLSGPYEEHGTHRAAHASFAARIEGIIQPSVEVYVGQIVAERKAGEQGAEARLVSPSPPGAGRLPAQPGPDGPR